VSVDVIQLVGMAGIETLGDLIDNHHRVGAWCPNGHGFRPIDMDVVIARLGRGWRFVGRGWPVVCAVCGSRLMITIAGDQRGPVERDADKRREVPDV
jgi:hypothetical protein